MAAFSNPRDTSETHQLHTYTFIIGHYNPLVKIIDLVSRQQFLFDFSFIFSIIAKRVSFMGAFSYGKREKSVGAKSSEYGS